MSKGLAPARVMDGQQIMVTPSWLGKSIAEAMRVIDWAAARQDVRRFLPLSEQEGLRL